MKTRMLARRVCATTALALVVLFSSVLASPAARGVMQFGGGGGSSGGSSGSSRSLVLNHTLSKRTHFFDIQCKGVYDKSIFARLDRICEDCYNLFREPQLHSLCRKNCFTGNFFKGCVDSLMLQDELEKIQTWIKQLHGADPGV